MALKPGKKAKKRPSRSKVATRSSGPRARGRKAPQTDELIDMNEAISLLKTSRPTFYRWLRSGKVKGMKVGRQWRFYRDDIERFLKGQEPRIELPADIGPLIRNLRERVEKFGAKDVFSGGGDVAHAVSLMIRLGIAMGASDIHITPHIREEAEGKVAVLRYRIDGVLHPVAEIDMRLLPAIVEQWKTMAACDVHEKTRPQDGRIVVPIKDINKLIDLRVSFLPAVLGESVTARILDPSVVPLALEAIQYAPHDRERLLRWIKASWGMIVIAGPTGSGKTTVLYAALNHVARPGRKVMAIEDPVEFLLPWVVQVQLNPKVGLTYPVAQRSVLRSDPDVIMIGELRDWEMLSIAQQSALTGHLVLTTLHADEAARVLRRMVDMGSDPFIVADSTKLVVAQRLVRNLCPDCSNERPPSADLLERVEKLSVAGGVAWNSLPGKFRESVGCSKCHETGFRGRSVIAETLEVTVEIGTALRRGASVDELREIAVEQGMTTMAADGIRRAAEGTTSLREVMRVLGMR